jgi:RNA polymerase sigma-70 factor (ECF subfamily)
MDSWGEPVRTGSGTYRRVQRAPKPTQSDAGPSDAALVVQARAGERWAQEALFRRHARMVNGLAFRLMGRDEDVDDLVQDSFLSAFRGLDRLANPQAFASWLASIVVRTAHKLIRRRRLMTRFGLRRNTPLDVEALIAPNAPAGIAADLARVYGCLDALGSEVRIALVLHRVDGLSIPDVAAQMKLSVSTVKRRLKVAEQRLAELSIDGRSA